jgi:hypothetical protein
MRLDWIQTGGTVLIRMIKRIKKDLLLLVGHSFSFKNPYFERVVCASCVLLVRMDRFSQTINYKNICETEFKLGFMLYFIEG